MLDRHSFGGSGTLAVQVLTCTMRPRALRSGGRNALMTDRAPKTFAIHPQGRFKADNGSALAAAAIAGLGIAYLPDFLTEVALASGALVPVMSRFPVPEAGIYMVRPPGRRPARKVRVLTELLIEHFG
jgi:DNA-binding transcriptional LysR family regulator